jgi:hypothetical protein
VWLAAIGIQGRIAARYRCSAAVGVHHRPLLVALLLAADLAPMDMSAVMWIVAAVMMGAMVVGMAGAALGAVRRRRRGGDRRSDDRGS